MSFAITPTSDRQRIKIDGKPRGLRNGVGVEAQLARIAKILSVYDGR